MFLLICLLYFCKFFYVISWRHSLLFSLRLRWLKGARPEHIQAVSRKKTMQTNSQQNLTCTCFAWVKPGAWFWYQRVDTWGNAKMDMSSKTLYFRAGVAMELSLRKHISEVTAMVASRKNRTVLLHQFIHGSKSYVIFLAPELLPICKSATTKFAYMVSSYHEWQWVNDRTLATDVFLCDRPCSFGKVFALSQRRHTSYGTYFVPMSQICMSPVMLTITFVSTVEFESGVEDPFATKTPGYCLYNPKHCCTRNWKSA